MKIYTKTGDQGMTSLIGGERVPKYHLRVETYGTVDELNSFIGLLRDSIQQDHFNKVLLTIQDRLFLAESLLAAPGDEFRVHLPEMKEADISLLEEEIDEMNHSLPELHSFILPGGHPIVSYCHIARCICRRAERLAVKLAETHAVDPLIIKYLNRLSDYLFVLARKLAKDLGVEPVSWKPKDKN